MGSCGKSSVTIQKVVSLSLGLTWSSKRGIQLSGQAKLEVTVPLHVSIADVIDIDSITIRFGASTSPRGIGLSAAITGGLTIGPVAANVDRVGVQATLAAPKGGQAVGNLGPVDLDLRSFHPKAWACRSMPGRYPAAASSCSTPMPAAMPASWS